MNEIYNVHLAVLKSTKKIVISVKLICVSLFKWHSVQKTFLHKIVTKKLGELPFNVTD